MSFYSLFLDVAPMPFESFMYLPFKAVIAAFCIICGAIIFAAVKLKKKK